METVKSLWVNGTQPNFAGVKYINRLRRRNCASKVCRKSEVKTPLTHEWWLNMLEPVRMYVRDIAIYYIKTTDVKMSAVSSLMYKNIRMRCANIIHMP